ncbi:MAG: hypothetical protein HUK15_01955 [Bacteroidales bacterium]|nr:hypothetical protein [Bacteroidales bacterium]
MKNLKIAMILVAAVALFCSCGDDLTNAPKVTMTDAEGNTEMVFDLGTASSVNVNFTANVDAAKGINSLTITRTMFNAAEEVMGDVVNYEMDHEVAGSLAETFAMEETLAAADVNGVAKVVYEVVVVDAKDAQASAAYTVNVKAAEYTEATFEWSRLGNTRTGLDEFGLQWTSNAKVVEAVIKPVEGAKLYILSAEDYAATSLEQITLPAEATQYKSVSCEASKDYNDVIATVYNGKTYVMNVLRGEVATVSGQGTKVTITGNYKAFVNEETPAAK